VESRYVPKFIARILVSPPLQAVVKVRPKSLVTLGSLTASSSSDLLTTAGVLTTAGFY
jgi:hypothetical protein